MDRSARANILIPPAELAIGVPAPRVEALIDADSASWGLAEGSGQRAPDSVVAACLAQVRATVRAIADGPPAGTGRYQLHYAGSTETAARHLGIALDAPNNSWRFCRGIDGADRALLEVFDDLVKRTDRRGGGQPKRGTGQLLVVLVGQDGAYAPAVRRLRAQGVPTWILQPGKRIAAALYSAATAVTRLTPATQPAPATATAAAPSNWLLADRQVPSARRGSPYNPSTGGSAAAGAGPSPSLSERRGGQPWVRG